MSETKKKGLERLFGGLKMKWGGVLLFALLAGVYTGAVMLVPALKETSFQDIGISYEWWVVFAVIVAVNCRKCTGAAAKCFVFFLVSQPVVYLVQVLAGTLSFDLAKSFYLNTWLPMTVLTLPGGLIAFFSKKQNMLGAAVLGLGNTIEAVMGAAYAVSAYADFPHHLLSALFSFASIVVMSLCIQKKAKCRAAALLIPVVLAGALIVLLKLSGRYLVSGIW